jgi:hypothetical protein
VPVSARPGSSRSDVTPLLWITVRGWVVMVPFRTMSIRPRSNHGGVRRSAQRCQHDFAVFSLKIPVAVHAMLFILFLFKIK